MDLETLLAEAQGLVRPWTMLTTEPTSPDQPIAGYSATIKNQPSDCFGYEIMIALYAQTTTSLPPLDAVLRFGSTAIQAWSKPFCEDNNWLCADDMPDRSLVDAYETVYQAQHPRYCENAIASIGGWHMVWPDGDWAELLEQQLLVCTYAEAEPWLEVWIDRSRNLKVVECFS
ncbi:hypothetical protein [Herpetosiphon gulosus]|uniref:Uncharacterized protein n=1 Tax=Herpetosiphon gulosus TaxID=1973496 RepID=A0ABP9X5W6_9CHLR